LVRIMMLDYLIIYNCSTRSYLTNVEMRI